jgi:uncharacterized integral membrane protein
MGCPISPTPPSFQVPTSSPSASSSSPISPQIPLPSSSEEPNTIRNRIKIVLKKIVNQSLKNIDEIGKAGKKLFKSTFQIVDFLASVDEGVGKLPVKKVINLIGAFGFPILESFTAITTTIHSTYDLAKNWKRLSITKKFHHGHEILQSQIALVSAVANLIQLTPSISSKIATMASVVITTWMIPLGLGILSVATTTQAIIESVKATRLTRMASAVDRLKNRALNSSFTKEIFEREKERFLNLRQFSILKSFNLYLTGIGLGAISITATLIAVGILAATAVTPVGWALAGVLIAGGIIGVGIYAYRRYQSKAKDLKEQQGFAREAVFQLNQENPSLRNNLQELTKQQQNFSLDNNEHKEKLVEFIVNDILGKSTLKEKAPKDSDERIDSAIKKLKKNHISIGEEELTKAKIKYAINQKNSQHLKESIKENLNSQIRSYDSLEGVKGKDIEKRWKKYFDKHMQIHLYQLVKEELKKLISEDIKKFAETQKEALPDLQFITNSKTKLEDKHIHHYVEQMISQSTWPKNKNLIQHVLSIYIEEPKG